MTQAKYPIAGEANGRVFVPKFLRTVMGLTENPSVYVQRLASFPINLFGGKWIRNVTIAGFGSEAITRLGLGVAGYRMFGPFKMFQPRAGLPANILEAVRAAREIAEAPADWLIHPVTRDAAVLTRFGNLNANLGNSILAAFTQADIDVMVNRRIIYATPVLDPLHLRHLAD
jgi:hypothetical protein